MNIETQGNYLYCIVETVEARNFGPIGIGGRGDTVTTIGCDSISSVVSPSPVVKYPLSRENLLAHQRVIEEVMKDHTVLPVRFSTIAESPEDIRRVLRKRHGEFKKLLRDMDSKVELGLKVLWKDMGQVFREIAGGDRGIKELRNRISSMPEGRGYRERIELGRLVEGALKRKREEESEEIISLLRDIPVDIKTGKTFGESMVLNGAFLVDRNNIREFDSRVEELYRTRGSRMDFKYIGPVPPFNFVNLVIEWK